MFGGRWRNRSALEGKDLVALWEAERWKGGERAEKERRKNGERTEKERRKNGLNSTGALRLPF
jgi:hypothetical protein